MTKEKYQIEYERLHEEGAHKYTIVGSPTHKKWTATAQADTFKELWEELSRQGEIDLGEFENDNEVYDEHKEIYYVPEPTTEQQYKRLIEEYLTDSNNYYYNQSNI